MKRILNDIPLSTRRAKKKLSSKVTTRTDNTKLQATKTMIYLELIEEKRKAKHATNTGNHTAVQLLFSFESVMSNQDLNFI